ncbi:hypothetical protein ACFQ3Z_15925 [Streptomyces nogalater]
MLRVIAALEAAWADNDDALATLMRGGPSETPLAALVAQYGASRVQTTILVITGITKLNGAALDEAMAQFRQGLVAHMTSVALSGMSGWAATAAEDVRATGDLARHVLRTLLSLVADGDDPESVRALFAHLRADAVARL